MIEDAAHNTYTDHQVRNKALEKSAENPRTKEEATKNEIRVHNRAWIIK
jgi:hypothetical protein